MIKINELLYQIRSACCQSQKLRVLLFIPLMVKKWSFICIL